MRYKSIVLFLFLSVANYASADQIVSFNLTGGGQTLSFSFSGSAPEVNEGDDFYVNNVSFTFGTRSAVASEIAFYDTAVGGGFALGDANGNILDNLAFTGDQVFVGSTSMPSFGGGPYNLASYFGDPTPLQLLVVSAAQPPATAITPEPTPAVLLGTGTLSLLALCGISRTTRKQITV